MRKQKYAALNLFAAVVLSLGLVACGGGGSGDEDAASGIDAAASCGQFCDTSGRLHLCDSAGEDLVVTCPAAHASTCTEDTGVPWCSCGSVVPGGTCYSDPVLNIDLVDCEDNSLAFYECPQGTECNVVDSSAGCYCDNASDGVCPDAVCVDDVDCQSCTPQCGDRQCGDNGCDGVCGTCPTGKACNGLGQCEATCTGGCGASVCGYDACGNSCGLCTSKQTCEAGQCVWEPDGVDCNSQQCSPGEQCCAPLYECDPIGSVCNFHTIECDGPEDCPLAGETCCRTTKENSSQLYTCMPASECGRPACHSSFDCSTGEACCSEPVGSPNHFCWPSASCPY